MTQPSKAVAGEIPPIVLLVDPESDTRDMYATSLEMSGYWVAVAGGPDEGMTAAVELQPAVIVASLSFDGRIDGLRFVRAVTESPATEQIPLVVLSGRPLDDLPRGARDHASLLLVKPVPPDQLTREIRDVVQRSQDLRAKSDALAAKAQRLRDKSADLLQRSAEIDAALDDRTRRCPACDSPLEWLERGTIGGIEYDYYRWCANACGLYCFDRGAGRFLKLS
jgi:DNA-binding response OmpR family regulator